jgi:hypothetical protein
MRKMVSNINQSTSHPGRIPMTLRANGTSSITTHILREIEKREIGRDAQTSLARNFP